MLTPIQIILLSFVFFALSRVYLRSKEKVISPQASIFWFTVWFVAAVGIIHPGTTVNIAEIFGVGRGVDVIVYLSMVLIFYLIFRIFVMIEDLRHEITFLIRQIALKDSNSKSKKTSKRK